VLVACCLVTVAHEARKAITTHLVPIWHRIWGLPAKCCPGNETWFHQLEPISKQQLLEWHHTTSWRARNSRVYRKQEWEMCYFVDLLCKGAIVDSVIFNPEMSQWLCSVCSTKKCLKCCSSMAVPSCSQACIPLRPSQNLALECCHTHHGVWILHCQIFTRLAIWKLVCTDTVTGMMKHCRLLCTSVCGGRRETFSGQ
jgi:hypothetical protein